MKLNEIFQRKVRIKCRSQRNSFQKIFLAISSSKNRERLINRTGFSQKGFMENAFSKSKFKPFAKILLIRKLNTGGGKTLERETSVKQFRYLGG